MTPLMSQLSLFRFLMSLAKGFEVPALAALAQPELHLSGRSVQIERDPLLVLGRFVAGVKRCNWPKVCFSLFEPATNLTCPWRDCDGVVTYNLSSFPPAVIYLDIST